MRIGVLGCGYWGSKHVRVLSGLIGPDRTVVIDRREERRRELCASFPGTRAFPSLEAALDHVDAVVVATPPSTHARGAERTLGAGKHVLVEKPLATSARDAERVVERAQQAGLTLMVGHTFEYNAAVWKLQEMSRAGHLGDVLYVDTARLNLGLYQFDCNVIWDLAPHDVSIINSVLGVAPSRVRTVGAAHAHRSLEDVAYIWLEYFDVGVTAQVHVSWLDPNKVRRVTIVGSRRMAVYNDLRTEERIRVYDKGVRSPELTQEMHESPMSYRYGDIVAPYIPFREPLTVMDEHFVECVESGKQPISDGERALSVVRTLEAAEVALREHRPVRLADLTV